jgi:signal transduction histidine kinase
MLDVTEERALAASLAVSSRLAALGTLVAGVAHEINNPLAGALACQELALQDLREVRHALARPGPLDRAVVAHGLDEILDAVLDARSGGQRIAGVVRDLGTFGRPDPRRQPLRLAEVVEDSVRWLSSSASSSATVQVRIDDAPAVMASAGQLQQVVINLVSNATASIPVGRPGRVDVRVGTSPRGQRLPGGRGQRCGDDARGHAADVRSVLHHQRGGEGAGAGPSHLPRHRHRPRRDHHRLEPPRRGLVVPGRDPGRDRGSTPHRRRP